ncbi:MerR family transcriptional regulator [Dactylosporangium sp. McL0621]|uniref:MerR family transcriptional regulator n=1 Tax=Dactylosporangium sp. McL0621 TaxID=3415678 RepID=UPI003CE838B7
MTRYTVEELAAKVGMSPRNVRAHQTRNLLGPPIRRGRTAYYDDGHVRRLEAIKALQRQGYNLVAIEAILGVRAPFASGEALQSLLQHLGREQPALVHALTGHGVLVHGEDGSMQMAPRLLRSVVGLHRAGVHPVPSLHILSEALDRLRGVAAELVRSTATSTSASRDPDGAADALVHLLTEAFRVALENVEA